MCVCVCVSVCVCKYVYIYTYVGLHNLYNGVLPRLDFRRDFQDIYSMSVRKYICGTI